MSELKAQAASDDRSHAVQVHHPRWTMFANGRLYRPAMRLAHRLGFCFPQAAEVEPGYVWCHWCGMRGKTTPEAWSRQFRRVKSERSSKPAA